MSKGPFIWLRVCLLSVGVAACTGSAQSSPATVPISTTSTEPMTDERPPDETVVALPEVRVPPGLAAIDELFSDGEIVAVVEEVPGLAETTVVQLSRGALDPANEAALLDVGITRIAECSYTRTELAQFFGYLVGQSWRDTDSTAIVTTEPFLTESIYGGMMQHCQAVYRVACSSPGEQQRLKSTAATLSIERVDFSTAAQSFQSYEWDPGKPDHQLGVPYPFRSDGDSPSCEYG